MKRQEKTPRDPLTGAILKAAFEVANTLGHGFLESVYQRALAHELEIVGLSVAREVRFKVAYKGLDIGTYIADMVVANGVIVELKSMEGPISVPQVAQCLNYLRASGIRKGLLINFGRSQVEYRRVVL